MYQSPHYHGYGPPQPGYGGPPTGPPPGPPPPMNFRGPPPAMNCRGPPPMHPGPRNPQWHNNRGPSWRPNVRPPGPPPRMQWPHHGPPPPGPGPHGGPPHFGPPRHRMPYNQPPNLPDSTHNFQGSAKRKHPANNYPQKKQKVQIDKRELAENNVFFCDTCTRGFKTDEKFQEHVAGHEECSVDGCPFVGAPKLVSLHFNLQHRGGMAAKIWKLESKEDVTAWIESRKRNYPTPSNVAKKKADMSARQERGETLDTKQFGKMKGNKKGDKQWKGTRRGARGQGKMRRKLLAENAATGEESNSDKTEASSDIPRTNGTVGQVEQSSVVDSSCNALGSIVASYDSDTEDIITASEPSEPAQNTKDIPCTKAERRKQKGKPQHQKQQNKKATLLEKLLAGDIRHERNVILQCVRHIARHHFFIEELEDTPDIATSDLATSDLATSDVATSDVVKSEVVKSDVVKSDVATSDVVKSEVATSVLVKSEVATSDVVKSEVATSVVVKSEVATSDVVKSEVATSDVAKSEVATSDVVKSEVATFDVVKSEVATSDVVKSEVATFDVVKSEVATSVLVKSEVATFHYV